MNNELNYNKVIAKRTWGHLLIGLLGIQALLELVLGLALLFNFPYTLKTGFGITYSSELDILGIALGLYLILLTALMIFSSVWTYKTNRAGITLAIIVGAFLLTFGLATFIKFGDYQGLLIDCSRGLLTIVFAYMAGKELKK